MSIPVAVDCIGRCTCNRHIILWSHIISIHCLRDFTLLTGSDPFYTSMTPLCYAIATCHMYTSQSDLDSPDIQETLKLSAVVRHNIVGKDLFWWPSFVKYWLIGGWQLQSPVRAMADRMWIWRARNQWVWGNVGSHNGLYLWLSYSKCSLLLAFLSTIC